jgi:dsRNA-specific ribonuclease
MMEPPLDESVMTKVKSYVVKGEVNAEVARRLSLGDCLRLGKGEQETGGREKDSLLSNAMEAVIGAIAVDGGMEEARAVVLRLFNDSLQDALLSGDYRDYKTELQEVTQQRFSELPEYRITGQDGLEHEKVFSVEVHINGELYGTGAGRSKKQAQQEAASEALNRLG